MSKSAGEYKHGATENFAHLIMGVLLFFVTDSCRNHQPPECFTDEKVNNKADIWSFGLLLHEIFVGVGDDDFPIAAFYYDDFVNDAKAGKLIPRALPTTCPAVAQELCSRCFEQDPTKRASATELLRIVDKRLAQVDR